MPALTEIPKTRTGAHQAWNRDYRKLVGYATLAASSHNTQPWKFKLAPDQISILPDLTRRCPVVDPDDHHLFVSLGCATENLVIAATASGLRGHAAYDASAGLDGEIRVSLEKCSPSATPHFDALLRRQCSRSEYHWKSVPTDQLVLLERAGQGNGVSVLLLTDSIRVEKVAEYVVAGNVAHIGDAGWMNELVAWIRFNRKDALKTRDGLYARCAGNSEAPRWLGQLFMRLVFSARSQNDKDVRHLRSSAGIAVFVSEGNDKARWVEVGRCYQRFALQATALNLRNAFMNQPVEVPKLRAQFANWLGIGDRRPDLVVRFGSGPEMPRSFRRPVDEVLL